MPVAPRAPVVSEAPTNARQTLFWYCASLAALLYLESRRHLAEPERHQRRARPERERDGTMMSMFSLAYLALRGAGRMAGDRIGPVPSSRVRHLVVWFRMATDWQWASGRCRWCAPVRRGEAGCFPDLSKALSNWFRGEAPHAGAVLMWLAARWGGALAPLLVVAALEMMTVAAELLSVRRDRLRCGRFSSSGGFAISPRTTPP